LRKRPASEEESAKRAFRKALAARHPRFFEALLADARITAAMRGERQEFRSRADALLQALRLIWVSDAFLAHAAYRLKARMQALGIPVLPRIAHRVAMITAQVSIGDPVLMHPGVYIVHGQVVADGLVEIHSGAILNPWITLGLIGPEVEGPTIGPGARIGTGAKVLGKVQVGENALVGANAVVLDDVPADTTVVGMPARPVAKNEGKATEEND
jgi:serine O-acetyltransferase